jgi:hypothetical protein
MLFRGDGDSTSRGQEGFETSRISARARFFETSSVLSSVFKPAVGSTKDSTFSSATAVSDPLNAMSSSLDYSATASTLVAYFSTSTLVVVSEILRADIPGKYTIHKHKVSNF